MIYFYFEAQTGVIHKSLPEAPSNYYRYTFDIWHLDTVRAIVERAVPSSCGLVHSPADLTWLDGNQIDRPGGLIPRPRNPNSRSVL